MRMLSSVMFARSSAVPRTTISFCVVWSSPAPPVRVMLVTVNFFVSMPVTVTVTVASVVPVRLRMLLSSVMGNVIVVVSAKSVRSTVPMTSWFRFSSVAVLPAT